METSQEPSASAAVTTASSETPQVDTNITEQDTSNDDAATNSKNEISATPNLDLHEEVKHEEHIEQQTETQNQEQQQQQQGPTDQVQPVSQVSTATPTGEPSKEYAATENATQENRRRHIDENGNDNREEPNGQLAESNISADRRQRRSYSTADSDDEDDDDEDALDAKIKQMNTPSNDIPGPEGKPLTERQLLEEKLDRLLKKPKVRRSRKDEDDLEQFMDEQILRLKDEMNIAAQMDIDTINKRIETGDTSLIAIQKVKLLPKVENVLSKANLADTILDNNLLQSVRIWLEPLPDGSLPSFEIQKVLFTAINNLPIKTEHLKESGLGRTMIFYTKSKRVEPQLARLAEKLIAEWTRPIIGASDNYRDKRIMQLEFDYEKLKRKGALDSALLSRKKKKQRQQSGEGSSGAGDDDDGDNDATSHMSLYEQAAARRGRAAAPSQTTTDYKYAPVSNVTALRTNSRASGVGSSLNSSELYKRLSSSLHKNKRK